MERLKFTLYGHFTGAERPSHYAEESNAIQSQDQVQKPDFDLYVPTWLMITLVVEVAIIGYINHNLTSWAAGTLDSAEVFAASKVSNLFFFMLFFFTAAPLGVYLFARLKLLDGNTKFLKLYSALGYTL